MNTSNHCTPIHRDLLAAVSGGGWKDFSRAAGDALSFFLTGQHAADDAYKAKMDLSTRQQLTRPPATNQGGAVSNYGGFQGRSAPSIGGGSWSGGPGFGGGDYDRTRKLGR
jgi:hypothetical protein